MSAGFSPNQDLSNRKIDYSEIRIRNEKGKYSAPTVQEVQIVFYVCATSSAQVGHH
jgi:hypothetical protein